MALQGRRLDSASLTITTMSSPYYTSLTSHVPHPTNRFPSPPRSCRGRPQPPPLHTWSDVLCFWASTTLDSPSMVSTMHICAH
ncbi:hypothetical protein BD779DRAFT_1225383 [Infundibulicybe gibba]|nr:hypothetical protein BD779DRAFT_1225383 [Infundibulicybe gibba]